MTPSTASMSLPVLISRGAPLSDLASYLAEFGPEARRTALAALGRAEQRTLYELAGAGPPVTLDDFVPAGATAPVAHHGFNTLPVPQFGRSFTKWMVRGPTGIGGYNASPFRPLMGPGYFVLRPTEGDEQRHGAVVVDYYRVPAGPFPPDWPWVVPSWFGPQALIYGWCHDYLRRVCPGVTIGAAYKWGYPVQSWFVLYSNNDTNTDKFAR
jgi:hypothetical protein